MAKPECFNYQDYLDLKEWHRWIPTSERTPNMFIDVLITVRRDVGNFVLIGYKCSDGKEYFDSVGDWYYSADDVLAWMPLPEPYGGEQS